MKPIPQSTKPKQDGKSKLVIYENLEMAFDFLNKSLFNSELKQVAFILSKGKWGGYYFPRKWKDINTNSDLDEICFNPDSFNIEKDNPLLNSERKVSIHVLSILLHEMCHQFHQMTGSPNKGYHCREFKTIMEKRGLITSHTGRKGGKRTGRSMSHYWEADSIFLKLANILIDDKGFRSHLQRYPDHKNSYASKRKSKYICIRDNIKFYGQQNLPAPICSLCNRGMMEIAPK
tara:strand:+ start:2387 stop:3082 length:696 start_codon:yes stop_codon:yes gene_type:complete